jgi:FYVE zinc finger
MNEENGTHRADTRFETDLIDVQGLGHLEIFLYEPGSDLKNSYYDCGAPLTANEDYISGMPNWPGYEDDTPNVIDSCHIEQQSTNVSDNFSEQYTTLNGEAKSSRILPESSKFFGNQKCDELIVRSISPSTDTAIAAATSEETPSICPQTPIEQHDPCIPPPYMCPSEFDKGSTVFDVNRQSSAVVLSQRKTSPGNREMKSPKQNVSEFRLYYDMLSALLTFRGASGRIAISSCLLLSRIVGRLLNHPCVLSVGGFASETMMFVADRTQCLSDHYLTSIIADDPEHLHIQRLLQAREALWGWVHQQSCFLSSLPWHQRQLLRETRDFDKHIEIATASLVNRSSNSAKADQTNGEKHAFIKDEDTVDIGDPTLLVRGGIAYVTHWLQGAAEDGDEEAQYALSRWFTRPAFEHSTQCYACSRQFNVTLFRHHCRCCGHSHCTQHSSQRRSLLRLGLGLISPVRVCDKCAAGVDQEVHIDNLTWRKMRVEAYLGNESGVILVKDLSTPPLNINPEGSRLIPYDNNSVDRNVDKIIRVADYSLKVIKSTVSLNYPTKLAIHTVDILKRYGLSGLAGVLLRRV